MTTSSARRAGDQDLYDLENDPYEQNNLAGAPAHRQRLADFRQRVLTWWRETGGGPLQLPQ